MAHVRPDLTPDSHTLNLSRTMRRIAVIGTFVWDTIHHPSLHGTPLEQWGGMAYSLCAFSAACPPGFSIIPIARVGEDLAESALQFAAALPNVVVEEGIAVVPESNNRVELRYGDGAERAETLTGGVGPWAADNLVPLLEKVDAIYVNFLSGFEMPLSVAEKLCGVGTPIYADLHSLFLGPAGAAPRQRRRLPEWERWVRSFDAVQLNEVELAMLEPERSDPIELLPDLIRGGPAAAFVTRGPGGASYCLRPGADDPFRWPSMRGAGVAKEGGERPADSHPPPVCEIPIGSPVLPGDPTGCGDVWGSVLFAALCGGMDVPRAARLAHAAAAAKIGERRIERLRDAIASEIRERG